MIVRLILLSRQERMNTVPFNGPKSLCNIMQREGRVVCVNSCRSGTPLHIENDNINMNSANDKQPATKATKSTFNPNTMQWTEHVTHLHIEHSCSCLSPVQSNERNSYYTRCSCMYKHTWLSNFKFESHDVTMVDSFTIMSCNTFTISEFRYSHGHTVGFNTLKSQKTAERLQVKCHINSLWSIIAKTNETLTTQNSAAEDM